MEEDQVMQEESGVETAPAAEVQESGVETPVSAEPKDNNFEKAFAKRLAAKEQEWQAKIQELESRYKDYDAYKDVADYFREVNQAPDVMSLKERIEMERLQQRADQQGISPEMQRRLEQLEAKAAEADQLKQQREQEERERAEQEQQTKAYQEFRSKLDAFAKEKGADSEKLYAFMAENQIGNPEAAYKAMMFDDMQAKLQAAEKEGMKKLLSAKSKMPTMVNTNQTGTLSQTPPKTFAEARERAKLRLSQSE